MSKRTTFRSNRELFYADTCHPLKLAAKRGEVCLAALGRGSYPGERLPRHDLKEVCMIGYWDAPRDQNWGLDWHCNEGVEIGYVSQGKLLLGICFLREAPERAIGGVSAPLRLPKSDRRRGNGGVSRTSLGDVNPQELGRQCAEWDL